MFEYHGKQSEPLLIARIAKEIIRLSVPGKEEALDVFIKRVEKFCKKLDEGARVRIDIGVTEKIKKHMQKTRRQKSLSMASRYEKHLRKLFANSDSRVLAELYETSRCLGLKDLTGGIYFLRNTKNGLIKIGSAKNIFKRIEEIEAAFRFVGYDDRVALEAVHMCFTPHIRLAERYFHKEFEEYRVVGEWFNVKQEDIREYLLYGRRIQCIGGVLVSLDDTEATLYTPIEKNFKINPAEVEYEYFGSAPSDNFLDRLFSHKISNKLYRLIRAIEESDVGIKCVYYDFANHALRESRIVCKSQNEFVDMGGLKELRFDPCWFEKRLKEIQSLSLVEAN